MTPRSNSSSGSEPDPVSPSRPGSSAQTKAPGFAEGGDAARASDAMRPTTIEPFATAAAGSVLITAGRTRVLCTASVSQTPPAWLPRDEQGVTLQGWVTAEYNMLPGSTPDRKRRGTDSRSTEIQRLIARSLRAAVDLEKMPGVAVTCDCDVIYADGGTRTASVTGGYVALAQALASLRKAELLPHDPRLAPVAAISVGLIDGRAHLDLDYALDSRAEVDMNVAMTAEGGFVEVQGTAERGAFSRAQHDELLDLASSGIEQLIAIQREALSSLGAD